jgi:tetratricopeptide (TPR) repeat protein/peroxiredoxin
MYRPFPALDFTLRDLEGGDHALSALRGKPAVVVFWSTGAPSSLAALQALAHESKAFGTAGVPVLAVAVDPPGDEPRVRAAAQGLGVPVMMATEEMAGAYSVLSRYLFDRREDLRLPTVLLIDGRGDVVKVFRDRILPAQVLADLPRMEASPAERLVRALPFAGTFYAPPGERNYFQYSLDLAEQGYDGPALAAFERTAKLDPIPITLFNLGTLYAKSGKSAAAKDAFERVLRIQPDYAEAGNSLGAILAQSGDVQGAIARFRAALKTKPDFPDALNNLGYALFQTGRETEARELYEKALSLQPDFPEAFNNLGIFFGQQGDLDRAERYFRQAVENRPEYGEAGNNLALVLAARGDAPGAIVLLQRLLERNPAFEMTYVTLAKVYLNTGRRKEGMQVLELLLQRNPKHPFALQLLRQVRGGG